MSNNYKIFSLNKSKSKDWRLCSNNHKIFCYTNMNNETIILIGNSHPPGSFCLCLVKPLYKYNVSWILPWNIEVLYGEIKAKITSSKKFAMTKYLVKESCFFMHETKTARMTIYLHTRPIVKLENIQKNYLS